MNKIHPLAIVPSKEKPVYYFSQLSLPLEIIAIVLFPIKFVLTFACIFGAGIAAAIIQAGSDPSRPLLKRRFRHYHDGCTVTGRLILFFHGLILKQYGKRDEEADVLCASHQHYLDAAVIAASCGGSAVAAAGMAEMWYLKTILKLSRAIIVLRGTKSDNRIASDYGIKPGSKCRDIMEERVLENREYDAGRRPTENETRWPQIIIFPEGIISNHRTLLRFHTSCFSLDQVRIEPYYIKYRTCLRLEWLTQSGIRAMFRSFLNPFGVCEIHWLDTIERQEEETADAFADRARYMISEEGGLVECPYTNFDMFYYIGWHSQDKCTEEYKEDFGKLGTILDARHIYGERYVLHQDDIPEIVRFNAKREQ